MAMVRIALANVRFPASPAESVELALGAIAEAGKRGAEIVCFPECFVPGYRAPNKAIPPPDSAFLAAAWEQVGAAAAKANVAVVLGTERIVNGELRATALVIGRDGAMLGFQDKVQVDPSEDGLYTPGSGRCVFQSGALTFGVVICHEGWRYPETVRWAARNGAQVVFHPHFGEAEPGAYVPSTFAEVGNTFHEKAVLCRAAENTCYLATVNCAGVGSPTTSAVAAPDGTVVCWQPYGVDGVLVAEIELSLATGFLAGRLRVS